MRLRGIFIISANQMEKTMEIEVNSGFRGFSKFSGLRGLGP